MSLLSGRDAFPHERDRRPSCGRTMSYASWDRELAATRALKHADSGHSVQGNVWNFAFGSNISASKVRSRGMKPVSSLRGRLPGWMLLFNHNGGYANIESIEKVRSAKYDLTRLPQPVPEEVHGKLILLSRREFAELARQEYAYDTVEVAVEVYPEDAGGEARTINALAFKTNACALTTTNTLPSALYLGIIQQGAKEASISAPYLRWLEAISPC